MLTDDGQHCSNTDGCGQHCNNTDRQVIVNIVTILTDYGQHCNNTDRQVMASTITILNDWRQILNNGGGHRKPSLCPLGGYRKVHSAGTCGDLNEKCLP